MKKAKLLKIFIDSNDRYKGESLWKYILKAVKKKGLSGATVTKGVAGIGSHSEIHTTDILSLSFTLPIVIEIIDDEDKLEDFLAFLENVIEEGVVIIQDIVVKIKRHR